MRSFLATLALTLALDREQTRTREGIVQSSIVALAKRIRIPSERVTRGFRNQRDDRDVCPQSAQIGLVRRDAIVENASFCKVTSEQRDRGGFRDSRCRTGQTSSRQRIPRWRQIDRRDRLGLLFDVGIFLNSLQARRSGN